MAQSCLTLVAKKICSIISALPLALRKLPRPPLTEVQKPDPRPDQPSIPEHHLAVRPVRVGLHRCRLHHRVHLNTLHLQSRRVLQLQGQQFDRQFAAGSCLLPLNSWLLQLKVGCWLLAAGSRKITHSLTCHNSLPHHRSRSC